MRAFTSFALTIAAVASLTGCATQPTQLATPDIVWMPGPPTGGLNDDPYVQAVVAANLGFVLASNSRDYTIAQLTDTNTADRVHEIYDATGRGDGSEEKWAGPFPQTPISVDERADGQGAEVLMCQVLGGWKVSPQQPQPSVDEQTAISATYVVIREGDALKVSAVESGSGGCEPGELATGVFDPAPALERVPARAPLTSGEGR